MVLLSLKDDVGEALRRIRRNPRTSTNVILPFTVLRRLDCLLAPHEGKSAEALRGPPHGPDLGGRDRQNRRAGI